MNKLAVELKPCHNPYFIRIGQLNSKKSEKIPFFENRIRKKYNSNEL